MSTENLVREIRPYSLKELPGIYNVCDKTMKKWIKPEKITIVQAGDFDRKKANNGPIYKQ